MLKLPQNFINALNGRELTKGMIIQENRRYFMVTKDHNGFYLTNLTSGFHYCDTFETPMAMVVAHFGTKKEDTQHEYIIYNSLLHLMQCCKNPLDIVF